MSEALIKQIDRLEVIYESELDPQGRAFVPLADAHRRLGDLDEALAIIQKGLIANPDFASAYVVAGWVHRTLRQTDEARRSFEKVLALDAENSIARAAIAELIDDQRAQAYRDKMAAKKAVEQASVPIASLAPDVPDEIRAEPEIGPQAGLYDDPVPIVPVASPGPEEVGGPLAGLAAAPGTVADDRMVVPISALAPDGGEEASYGGALPSSDMPGGDIPGGDIPGGDEPSGREIYTETLAELYAGQGAIDQAIEIYRKLITDDPVNGALRERLAKLELIEPGSGPAPAELDVRAGLGVPPTDSGGRRTVPIESLAPDGNDGDGVPDDPFPHMNRAPRS